jgi:hypothetical protein
MTLPPEFQLAFHIYGVELEVNALRRKIWALIEPSLGAALDEHFREAIAVAPSFREALTTNVAPYKDSIIKGTERLFTRSFDAGWVEDATKRVETEIALGFDMRARPAVANTIGCTLNRILSRKWLSRRSAARLTNEAIRILNLDIVAAVAIHYTARVRRWSERSTKLEHAIEAFSKTVEEVRGLPYHRVPECIRRRTQYARGHRLNAIGNGRRRGGRYGRECRNHGGGRRSAHYVDLEHPRAGDAQRRDGA